MNDTDLQSRLETDRYGRSRELLDDTKSTNDDARTRAEAGAPDGHLIVAARQSEGRGSHGRMWSSPKGGLYFSVVLRPALDASALPPLTLAAGLAVAEAIEEHAPEAGTAEVKWPNDVLLGGKKCAGILVETATLGTRLEHAIVGIGINIGREAFEAGLSEHATTVPDVDRAQLLASILGQLESGVDRLCRYGPEPLIEALSPRLALEGALVRCGDVEGRLVGLAPTGALRIATEDSVVEVVSGRLSRL